MATIVLFDAFVFNTPFYYIIYYAIGMLIGKVFTLSHKVQVDEENLNLRLVTNRGSIVILLMLVLIRFVAGEQILESLHVAEIMDALYLFFIGIYYAKWKVIVHQIDDLYYSILANTFKNKNS